RERVGDAHLRHARPGRPPAPGFTHGPARALGPARLHREGQRGPAGGAGATTDAPERRQPPLLDTCRVVTSVLRDLPRLPGARPQLPALSGEPAAPHLRL